MENWQAWVTVVGLISAGAGYAVYARTNSPHLGGLTFAGGAIALGAVSLLLS